MKRRFIQYCYTLEGLSYADFEKRFNAHKGWDGIKRETEAYGIDEFGHMNDRDVPYIEGEVTANTKQGCKGLIAELKAWLKQAYWPKQVRLQHEIFGEKF